MLPAATCVRLSRLILASAELLSEAAHKPAEVLDSLLAREFATGHQPERLEVVRRLARTALTVARGDKVERFVQFAGQVKQRLPAYRAFPKLYGRQMAARHADRGRQLCLLHVRGFPQSSYAAAEINIATIGHARQDAKARDLMRSQWQHLLLANEGCLWHPSGMTIDDIIAAAGGVVKLAELAGVAHSTVIVSWRRTGRVPVERALVIHDKLGIPLHEIRPDVWRKSSLVTNQQKPETLPTV